MFLVKNSPKNCYWDCMDVSNVREEACSADAEAKIEAGTATVDEAYDICDDVDIVGETLCSKMCDYDMNLDEVITPEGEALLEEGLAKAGLN